MLPTSAGVEPETSWSPVGRRIQLSHRGRLNVEGKRVIGVRVIEFRVIEFLLNLYILDAFEKKNAWYQL